MTDGVTNSSGRGQGPGGAATTLDANAVYRKVTLRLLPFLMLCYLIAYFDRVNVGFAKLQMLGDLKFSETVYGTGAGLFFIGYFFLEVPSNLALHKFGARIWIGRIMISWGLISAAFFFVKTATVFYILRFLLGMAEAGFYPGIILYLTYWYPSIRRARMNTLFMTAIPISGIFGGPISGWIMESFAGTNGWTGWQWLFLLEAAPAVLLGFVVMVYLDNGIRSAKWLSEGEKQLLERTIAEDYSGVAEHSSTRAVLADRRVWVMCAIYFCIVMASYGLTFWMPTLISAAGIKGTLRIGLFTAIPYTGGVIGMLLFARNADRTRERRLHLAAAMVLGAVLLSASTIAGTQTVLAVTCLTIAAAGVMSSAPLFWSLPTAFLGRTAAAAGIAAINSIGNLAGFVSPYVVGWLKDYTNSTQSGMFVVAGMAVLGAMIVLRLPSRLVNK